MERQSRYVFYEDLKKALKTVGRLVESRLVVSIQENERRGFTSYALLIQSPIPMDSKIFNDIVDKNI